MTAGAGGRFEYAATGRQLSAGIASAAPDNPRQDRRSPHRERSTMSRGHRLAGRGEDGGDPGCAQRAATALAGAAGVGRCGYTQLRFVRDRWCGAEDAHASRPVAGNLAGTASAAPDNPTEDCRSPRRERSPMSWRAPAGRAIECSIERIRLITSGVISTLSEAASSSSSKQSHTVISKGALVRRYLSQLGLRRLSGRADRPS